MPTFYKYHFDFSATLCDLWITIDQQHYTIWPRKWYRCLTYAQSSDTFSTRFLFSSTRFFIRSFLKIFLSKIPPHFTVRLLATRLASHRQFYRVLPTQMQTTLHISSFASPTGQFWKKILIRFAVHWLKLKRQMISREIVKVFLFQAHLSSKLRTSSWGISTLIIEAYFMPKEWHWQQL